LCWQLHETETQTVLQLAGVCVWAEEAALHAHVTAKNAAYKRLVEERPAKDIYAHRAAQTFNGALKDKEVWAQPPPTRPAVWVDKRDDDGHEDDCSEDESTERFNQVAVHSLQCLHTNLV
jgi:hypothetical protein